MMKTKIIELLDLLTSEQLNDIWDTDKEYCIIEPQATNTMSWADIELVDTIPDDLDQGSLGVYVFNTIEIQDLVEMVIEYNAREVMAQQALAASLKVKVDNKNKTKG